MGALLPYECSWQWLNDATRLLRADASALQRLHHPGVTRHGRRGVPDLGRALDAAPPAHGVHVLHKVVHHPLPYVVPPHPALQGKNKHLHAAQAWYMKQLLQQAYST